jgi:hypothetical protein
LNTGAADSGAFVSLNTASNELWVTLKRTVSSVVDVQIAHLIPCIHDVGFAQLGCFGADLDTRASESGAVTCVRSTTGQKNLTRQIPS